MEQPENTAVEEATAKAANDAAVWAKLEAERLARLEARKAALSAEEVDVAERWAEFSKDLPSAEGVVDLDAAEQEPMVITTDNPDLMEERRIPMNRAQRRQQVRLYAMLLANTERQRPVVNPTIIPKSKRRRKGRGNVRLHSALG